MDESDELVDLRAEVAAQHRQLAEQEAALSRLQAQVAALASSSSGRAASRAVIDARPGYESSDPEHRAPVSRRRLLGLTAAGVGGAALVTAFGAEPALADDPNDITIGSVKSNTFGTATGVDTTSTVNGAQMLFQSGDTYSPPQSSRRAALAGWASVSGASDTGVYAFSEVDGGAALFAFSTNAVGIIASGQEAALQLSSQGTSGPPTGTATVNDVQAMDDGVWICIAGGATPTWRKVQGAQTAGAFHAIAPVRVYDSRLVGARTPITAGQTRVVSVANQISGSGTIQTANVVPAGATAIVANLTITDMVTGSGYLSVTPNGGHATSSINWQFADVSLANGLTTVISSSREVSVYASKQTHFLIDVSGYYL